MSGLDDQRMWRTLANVWPRTYGDRTSWAQPSIAMARAIVTEYDSLTPPEPTEDSGVSAARVADIRAAVEALETYTPAGGFRKASTRPVTVDRAAVLSIIAAASPQAEQGELAT